MTSDRLGEILTALQWSDRTLAVVLSEHWTTVRHWHVDPSTIPPNVEHWLERIAQPILAHPQPEGWLDRDN